MESKQNLIDILKPYGNISKTWAQKLENNLQIMNIIKHKTLPKHPIETLPHQQVKQVDMHRPSLGPKPGTLYKKLYIKYLSYWFDTKEISPQIPLYVLQIITNYCNYKSKK